MQVIQIVWITCYLHDRAPVVRQGDMQVIQIVWIACYLSGDPVNPNGLASDPNAVFRFDEGC